jgi:hypothetical protein
MAGVASSYLIFKSYEKSADKQFEKFKDQPQIEKAIEYFKQKAPTIKTVDDFFKDRKLLEVALNAYGLEGDINYMGRLKRILTSDPKDKDSLVNRMRDPRYAEMTEAFKFASLGTTKLGMQSFLQEVTEKFQRNQFEKSLGNGDPALREAAYFRRMASKMNSVWDVLGDKVMRQVVTTTLGLPDQVVNQSIDKQGQLVTDKIDIAKFKDPKWVDQFLEKYLIKKDAQRAGATVGTVPAKNAVAGQLFANAGGNSLLSMLV